jgi:hypothetical protein
MSFRRGLDRFRPHRPPVRLRVTGPETCHTCGKVIVAGSIVWVDRQYRLSDPVPDRAHHEACWEKGAKT